VAFQQPNKDLLPFHLAQCHAPRYHFAPHLARFESDYMIAISPSTPAHDSFGAAVVECFIFLSTRWLCYHDGS